MDTQTYAILDEAGGWLVNLVLWDGDSSTWQPPFGTKAVLLSDVDLASLPVNPTEIPQPE